MATAPLAASTSRSTTSEPKQQPRTVDDDGEDEDDNNKEPDCVPRLSVDEAKEGVLRAFLEANRPFIIVGAASGWRATREWVAEGEADDFVTPDRLVAALGADVSVPVVESTLRAGAGGGGGGEYGEEPRREMALGEYAALWQDGVAKAEGLYMKDFHFVLRQREKATAQEGGEPGYYAVPPPLDDDWLNEWWDAKDDDDSGRVDDLRFMYLGPAGSRTPLHHDVLCSYSWSANLAGSKRWRLFHPRHTPRLLHRRADRSGASPTLAADADSPLLDGVPRLTVEQGPGELLFVPSGWHHQVENLTGCLSLNHNWFNGSALPRVAAFLQAEAAAVRARLAHLEGTFDAEGAGWARQCEAVLRANAAMALTDWATLLVRKARGLLLAAAEGGGGDGGHGIAGGEHRARQWRRDVRRVLVALQELRHDPCLLNSLFPPHLEARLRLSGVKGGEEEEDGTDVWPPPPPPSQEALRPLVEAWLDTAIAACERGGHGGGTV